MQYEGKPTVLLDSDDVVGRCVHGMIREINLKLGTNYVEEDIPTWDVFETINQRHPDQPHLKGEVEELMKSKNWCKNIEAFDGAVEGVERLKQIASVFFVTAPYESEFWEYERRVWLSEKFGLPRWHIMQGSSKFLCRGEFFVDDKPANLRDWHVYDERGIALLWNRPHNQHENDFIRICSWEELYDFVVSNRR